MAVDNMKKKAKRKPGGGRKKSKPDYNPSAILQNQMDTAVALYDTDKGIFGCHTEAVWVCAEKMKPSQMKRMQRRKNCIGCSYRYGEISLEQSFMEMLYDLKRGYQKNGRRSILAVRFRKIENQLIKAYDEEQLGQEYQASVDEEDFLVKVEKKLRQQMSIHKSIGYEVGVTICANMLKTIRTEIKEHKAEQQVIIEKINKLSKYRKDYEGFLTMLLQLPETNLSGLPMRISGLDCDGSERRSYHGEKKRPRGRKVTREIIERSPDFLTFSEEIFSKYIVRGFVYGDRIEYITSFGVKIQSTGNLRNLGAFIGFRVANQDGTLKYIDHSYDIPGVKVRKINEALKP